jgi:hypothetical protein
VLIITVLLHAKGKGLCVAGVTFLELNVKTLVIYLFSAWGSKPRVVSVPCVVPLGYV